MKHIAVPLLLGISLSSNAQLPSDFRSEQVAISMDKYAAKAGDTLGIEGQVCCMAADRFLPYSNYVYIECISAADSVLCRHKVNCKDGGHFALRLPVAYEWPAGTYYLRAYTRLMMNFSDESFCVQPFLIGRKFNMRENDTTALRCMMSVVGGRLMAGCMQRVAVCVQNVFGFPASVTLDLKDDNGEAVATVRTSKAGMAVLNFVPQAGSHYFLLTQDGANRFALPEVANSGMQLQGDMNGTRIRYRINGGDAAGGYQLCAYDRLNGLQRYSIGGKNTGIIQLNDAPEVASLFLMDTEGNIVREATLAAPKAVEGLKVSVSDTVKTGEALVYDIPKTDDSVRILTRLVADNVPIAPMEAELKYLSDYQSALPFPTDAYICGNEQRREDLYIWLSSARFKRFDAAEALREKEQTYRHMPEYNMTFGGTVKFTNGKPLDGGSILAYNTENNNVYVGDINTQGRFRMAVDDFAEGVSFYVEAKSAKGKEDFYKYDMDSDTFPDVRGIALQNAMEWQDATPIETAKGVKPGFNDSRYFSLPAVEVKARVQSPYNTPTNKFYSTNYVDREEIEKKDYHNLLQILQRMPGLNVFRTDDGKGRSHWEVHTKRGASTFGGSKVLILLDGMRMETSEVIDNLMETTAFEIESVELLQPWQTNAVVSGAINGCVSIKTRNVSAAKKNIRTKGTYYTPIGIVPQDRSEPAASNCKASEKGDMRLCIDIVSATSIKSTIVPIKVTE